MPGTKLLVLFGLLFYLGASLLLWHLLLKEPARRPPMTRRPRRGPIRLAKVVATLVGGAASGAASLLVITTVVNAGKPGTMSPAVTLAVWAVATVAAMLLIGRAPSIRRVVSRTCLVLGVQGVTLPLATLVSFVVAGARLASSAGTGGERTAEYMGVRLAGHVPAVWIGVGGFCIGLALVIVGDRARRRVVSRRGSRRFRSARSGTWPTRIRPG